MGILISTQGANEGLRKQNCDSPREANGQEGQDAIGVVQSDHDLRATRGLNVLCLDVLPGPALGGVVHSLGVGAIHIRRPQFFLEFLITLPTPPHPTHFSACGKL